jgi:hypothetical protein
MSRVFVCPRSAVNRPDPRTSLPARFDANRRGVGPDRTTDRTRLLHDRVRRRRIGCISLLACWSVVLRGRRQSERDLENITNDFYADATTTTTTTTRIGLLYYCCCMHAMDAAYVRVCRQGKCSMSLSAHVAVVPRTDGRSTDCLLYQARWRRPWTSRTDG